MINAVLIDDESKGIEILRILLKSHCPEVTVVGWAEEIDEGIRLISRTQPDLVFLDIEMSGESGFDLLEKTGSGKFHVIFVTAHSEYAVRAFRYSVSDYLLKPVDTSELREAVLKVNTAIKDEQYSETQPGSHHVTSRTTLKIPVHDRAVFVKTAEIIRIEADGAYTKIFLTGNRHYVISYNIKVMEEHLDMSEFMRVHRSHIINLNKVTSITAKGNDAIMTDGAAINVARRCRQCFMSKIEKRLGKPGCN